MLVHAICVHMRREWLRLRRITLLGHIEVPHRLHRVTSRRQQEAGRDAQLEAAVGSAETC